MRQLDIFAPQGKLTPLAPPTEDRQQVIRRLCQEIKTKEQAIHLATFAREAKADRLTSRHHSGEPKMQQGFALREESDGQG